MFSNPTKFLKKNILLIGIVLLFIIIAIYLLHTNVKEGLKLEATKTASAATKTASAVIQPVPKPYDINDPTSANWELTGKVNTVLANDAAEQASITKLQGLVGDLNSKLSTVQTASDQWNAEKNNITNQQQVLMQQNTKQDNAILDNTLQDKAAKDMSMRDNVMLKDDIRSIRSIQTEQSNSIQAIQDQMSGQIQDLRRQVQQMPDLIQAQIMRAKIG